MNTHSKQQPNKKPSKIIRLLTLGNSTVGKSSIVIRFTENKFYTSYLATIGVDFMRKLITFHNEEINLQIWDSAGQEKYNSISKQYYNKADGILLVFDVSKRPSFEAMATWLQEIETSSAKGIPICMLGNKCDLAEREVSMEEGNDFAEGKGILYYETSALTGENVSEAFMGLVEKAVEFQKRNEMSSKGAVTLNKTSVGRGCC